VLRRKDGQEARSCEPRAGADIVLAGVESNKCLTAGSANFPCYAVDKGEHQRLGGDKELAGNPSSKHEDESQNLGVWDAGPEGRCELDSCGDLSCFNLFSKSL
jgi:hypothetical protein